MTKIQKYDKLLYTLRKLQVQVTMIVLHARDNYIVYAFTKDYYYCYCLFSGCKSASTLFSSAQLQALVLFKLPSLFSSKLAA